MQLLTGSHSCIGGRYYGLVSIDIITRLHYLLFKSTSRSHSLDHPEYQDTHTHIYSTSTKTRGWIHNASYPNATQPCYCLNIPAWDASVQTIYFPRTAYYTFNCRCGHNNTSHRFGIMQSPSKAHHTILQWWFGEKQTDIMKDKLPHRQSIINMKIY